MDIMSLLQQSGFGGGMGGPIAPMGGGQPPPQLGPGGMGGPTMGGAAQQSGGLLDLLKGQFGGGQPQSTGGAPPSAGSMGGESMGLPPSSGPSGPIAPMGGNYQPKPMGGPIVGGPGGDGPIAPMGSSDPMGLPPGVDASMGGPPPPGPGMGQPAGGVLPGGMGALPKGGASFGGGVGGIAGNAPSGPTMMQKMGKGAGAFGSAIGKGMMAQGAPKPMAAPSGNISPFQAPQYKPPGQQMGRSSFRNPFEPIR